MKQLQVKSATPEDDSAYRKEIIGYAKQLGVELAPNVLDFITGGLQGVLLSSVLSTMLADVRQRSLSDKEKARVNKLVILGANKFMANMNARKTTADYVQEDAEEVIEALLMTAQHEHQQRKIKYLGNLLGNLGFRPELGQYAANHLIKMAEQISYRQLVLLQVFADGSTRSLMPNRDYRNKGNIPWDVIAYMHEIKELYEYGLLSMPGDTMLGLTDVNPGKMRTLGHGLMLQTLMELDSLPQTNLHDVVAVLGREF